MRETALRSAQAAFRILSRELYGPNCPFERANDLSLSICCHANGVVKIRGHGLFWGGPSPEHSDELLAQARAHLPVRVPAACLLALSRLASLPRWAAAADVHPSCHGACKSDLRRSSTVLRRHSTRMFSMHSFPSWLLA